MFWKKQKQNSGDNSKNLQAGRDINISGLSYSETKEIVKQEAQLVFKQNSLVLAEEAYKKVIERSDELLDNFLAKLEERRPEAISSLKDPGMQYALFNAQKEYAKTGDKDLASLLEDILVERAKNPNRDLLQIVLEECVSVAPKLTPDQFDALSLIFVVRYAVNYSCINIEQFIDFLNRFYFPFQSGIRKEDSRYQHLEFSGCGSITLGTLSLASSFRNTYSILFSKGFSAEDFEHRLGSDIRFKKYLTKCYHDDSKFQINIINLNKLEEIGKSDNLTEKEINGINAIYSESLMNEDELKKYLIQVFPPIKNLFENWDNSSIKNMTLTSVGIAIGHANIVRKTKEIFDLHIWIK